MDKLPEKLLELAECSNNEKKDNSYLSNLLQSVIWGLLFQFHSLLCQKEILLSILQSRNVLQEGVVQIVDTLEDELSGSLKKQQQMKGIFRFRKVVIFVLAFNRLLKLKNNKHCAVLHHKPSFGHNGLIFFPSVDQTTSAGEFIL